MNRHSDRSNLLRFRPRVDERAAVSRFEHIVQVRRVKDAGAKPRILKQPPEEWQRCLDTGHEIFVERSTHTIQRPRSIFGPGHKFRDKWVVENGHVPARSRAAVVAYAGSRWRTQLQDPTGRR